jgi:hypothetical protein
MAIANVEREQFGPPLAPIERLVAGLIVIVAAAGHLALLAAAVVYFYALLLPVL